LVFCTTTAFLFTLLKATRLPSTLRVVKAREDCIMVAIVSGLM
jgi:hypothetical protein